MRSVIVTIIISSVFAFAGAAGAQVFEVDVPRDPAPIPAMQRALHSLWETCDTQLYPRDTTAGAAKASSIVELKPTGKRKVRGVLTIGFHKLDGTPVKPSSAQRALARCIRDRFEKKLFHGEVAKGRDRWALANPYRMNPVTQAGKLGRAAAVRHISGLLPDARNRCRVARATRLTLEVEVGKAGKAETIAVTGTNPGRASCIRTHLERRLRFPKISESSVVKVLG